MMDNNLNPQYDQAVEDLKQRLTALELLKVNPAYQEYQDIRPIELDGVPSAELSLREFIKQAWHLVEPATPFVDGFHIGAICEHLQAVSEGQIQRLLINLPPRHMKSLSVGVFWPVWEWIRKPSIRWLFAAYAANLAVRDAVASRRIIDSEWYQRRWGRVFQLTNDQNEKTRYVNDKTGYRLTTSVSGSATGEGGDRLVIDDAHNMNEALSDHVRKAVITWFRGSWSTRANDPKTAAWVMVMQRCHSEDLSGFVLEQGGWEHLCLPGRYIEEPVKRKTSIGWTDPRTKQGELLWTERFDEKSMSQIERDLGSYGTAGQIQQRPVPSGGGLFKNHWWMYWQPVGHNMPSVSVQQEDGVYKNYAAIPLPKYFDEIILSCDFAFKDLLTSDYVHMAVWARKGSDKFLLDEVRERMNLPDSIRALVKLINKWPLARRRLIEEKANGAAVIQVLKGSVSGLIAIDPDGSKESRAAAASPTIEAGDVYLPHVALYPWVSDFIIEHQLFPNGAYDDRVDTTSQAMSFFEKRKKSSVPVIAGYQEHIDKFFIVA